MNWAEIIKGGLGAFTALGVLWFGWKLRKMYDGDQALKKAEKEEKAVIDYTKKLQDLERQSEKKLSDISSNPSIATDVSGLLSGNTSEIAKTVATPIGIRKS